MKPIKHKADIIKYIYNNKLYYFFLFIMRHPIPGMHSKEQFDSTHIFESAPSLNPKLYDIIAVIITAKINIPIFTCFIYYIKNKKFIIYNKQL